jgi:hypothetical protein
MGCTNSVAAIERVPENSVMRVKYDPTDSVPSPEVPPKQKPVNAGIEKVDAAVSQPVSQSGGQAVSHASSQCQASKHGAREENLQQEMKNVRTLLQSWHHCSER